MPLVNRVQGSGDRVVEELAGRALHRQGGPCDNGTEVLRGQKTGRRHPSRSSSARCTLPEDLNAVVARSSFPGKTSAEVFWAREDQPVLRAKTTRGSFTAETSSARPRPRRPSVACGPAAPCSGTELLICLVARLMEDQKPAFIGTGVPMLAAALAKKLHAPDLMAVFEFGGTDPVLDRLPLNVGAQQTFHRAISAISLAEVMEAAQRGLLEYGFLGAAQIDPFGNLNTTVIGDHARPAVRLPGSGGGCDIGALCWKTIALVPNHNRQKFVERLDFMTTAGYLDGPGARERAGLPRGTGPFRVVSDLAVLDYDEATRRMRLLSVNPGVTAEAVQRNTGFELQLPACVATNAPPTARELRILRNEVDPHRLYI